MDYQPAPARDLSGAAADVSNALDYDDNRKLLPCGADPLTRQIEAAHVASDDPFFRPLEDMKKGVRDLFEVRQAALRIIVGMDSRPLRAVARELGVRHSSFTKVCHTLAQRLGMDFALASTSARAAWKEAARHRLKRGPRDPVPLRPEYERHRQPWEIKKPNGVASEGLVTETDHHAQQSAYTHPGHVHQ